MTPYLKKILTLEDQWLRLLLVEDRPEHGELISLLLKQDNNRIETAIAANVESALSEINSFDPDVILSDYRLGNHTCFTLLENMSAAGKNIPVIILTGQGDEKVAAEAIGAGAFDYLIKDQVFSDFSTLRKSIATVYQRHMLQLALEESEELYRTLVENIQDGVFILSQGTISYGNPAMESMFAHRDKALVGTSFAGLFEGEDVGKASEAIAAAAGGTPQQNRFVFKQGKSTSALHADITFNRVIYAGQEAVIGTMRDVTREVETQAKLEQALADKEKLSITDELTGLFNRRYAFAVLADEIERSLRYQHELSIIMLDLDNFKMINDEFGHISGDDVLRMVADSFSKELRKADIASRYGGDEFLIILPHTSSSQAAGLAERIRDTILNLPAETAADLSVSCGVATLPERPGSIEAFIHSADTALLAAKDQGKNKVVTA